MADYQQTQGDCILRTEDGALIPADTGNADWRRYQAWLADDNTPDPAPAPPVIVPASVTNFQGRTVLRLHGLFDAVEAAIAAIEDPLQGAIAREAFERGSFEIDSPLLNQLLTQMGKDGAFRDQLFIEAAAISA